MTWERFQISFFTKLISAKTFDKKQYGKSNWKKEHSLFDYF